MPGRLGGYFLTLLAFRHLVQTAMRLGVPFTITRIFWTLGFHRRRERRCECEMLLPNPGDFPQTSHTDAIRLESLANAPGSQTLRLV